MGSGIASYSQRLKYYYGAREKQDTDFLNALYGKCKTFLTSVKPTKIKAVLFGLYNSN
jgi:hypothetical protein